MSELVIIVLFGYRSVISNNIIICDNITIGELSVVIKNIFEPAIFYGNPDKKKN